MLFRDFTQGLAHLLRSLSGRRVADPWTEIAYALRNHFIAMDTLSDVADEVSRRVVEHCRAQQGVTSVAPSKLFLETLKEELERILGSGVPFKDSPRPLFYMLVGLQGTGKTTMAQKLGFYLKERGEKVLLVPLDLRRPAAVEQLRLLGEAISLPVYLPSGTDPKAVAAAILKEIDLEGFTALIFDTAGRHTLELQLLDELKKVFKLLRPQEVLYVLDATQGQSAFPVIEGFRQTLSLTGILLSKVDLDPKGGAVLSVRWKTFLPVKGMGIGERPEDFRAFDPSWVARQLLDLGDLAGMMTELNRYMEEHELVAMGERFLSGRFHLQDLLRQMELMSKMGSWERILSFLPGGKSLLGLIPQDDSSRREMVEMLAILRSMTLEERLKPQIIQNRRIMRIARGSGTDPQKVRRLLKRFEEMKKMARRLSKLPSGVLRGGGLWEQLLPEKGLRGIDPQGFDPRERIS